MELLLEVLEWSPEYIVPEREVMDRCPYLKLKGSAIGLCGEFKMPQGRDEGPVTDTLPERPKISLAIQRTPRGNGPSTIILFAEQSLTEGGRSLRLRLVLTLSLPLWLLSTIPTVANSQEAVLLQRTWGTSEPDLGTGVAVDRQGNTYLSGFTTDFLGYDDVLLLKFDTLGDLKWQRTWASGEPSTSHSAQDIAVDDMGDSYVTGSTSTSAAYSDVLLLKFDDAGNLEWQKAWGDTNHDYGLSVGVASVGEIYVTGTTYSDPSYPDVFLLKFDDSGGMIWQKRWGGSSGEYGGGVAIDSFGNIYVTGATYSFGPASGSADVFLLKFRPSGSLMWHKVWGGDGGEFGADVAVDPSGHVYVVGSTNSFGAGSGVQGAGDVFLLKVDPSDGNLEWQKTWGGTGDDYGGAVDIDSKGDVYLTGSTSSVYGGFHDVFLLKFGPTGEMEWQKTWGGSDGSTNDFGQALVVDGSGNAVVVGQVFAPPPYGITSSSLIQGTSSFSPSMGLVYPVDTALAVRTLDGSVSDPQGSLTYSGGGDALILKYDIGPPTWPLDKALQTSAVGPTSLALSWTPASDNGRVVSYRVYQGATLLATVPSTIPEHKVADLTPETSYTFKVEAVDAADNWSSDGPSVTVTTEPLPRVPTIPLPWWQQYWLIALVGLFSIAVGSVAVFRRAGKPRTILRGLLSRVRRRPEGFPSAPPKEPQSELKPPARVPFLGSLGHYRIPVSLLALGSTLVVAAFASIPAFREYVPFAGLLVPGILLLGIGSLILFRQLYQRPPSLKRFCMHCGFHMLSTDVTCSRCHKQPPSGVDTILCPACSSVIPALATFCRECGARQTVSVK